MNDLSVRQQFLIFLAITACLAMSFQAARNSSFAEPTGDTLRCVEASLVTSSSLLADSADEESCDAGLTSAKSLSLFPSLSDTTFSEQRRKLVAARTSLAEGFPAGIDRPPIAAV